MNLQHGQMRIHSNASNVSGHSEGHNMMPFLNSRLSAHSNNSIDKMDQNFLINNF